MTTDGEAYRDLRTTVIGLAQGRGAELDEIAPATPEWRVRDVLSHLAGVCDDVVHGNLGGVATDGWTAAQVAKRADWSVERILEQWEEDGAALDPIIDGTPPGTFGQLLYDAWTHEQDVRGALGSPGGREGPAMDCAFAWGIGQMQTRDRDDARTGLVLDAGDDGEWVVGTAPAAGSVHTSRFELMRAFTGRRSLAQLRAWDWDPDPEPARLVFTIFTPRPTDLVE